MTLFQVLGKGKRKKILFGECVNFNMCNGTVDELCQIKHCSYLKLKNVYIHLLTRRFSEFWIDILDMVLFLFE